MEEKESKEEAFYMEKSQTAGQHCGNCEYFNENRTCDKVEGDISPEGWCVHWEKR